MEKFPPNEKEKSQGDEKWSDDPLGGISANGIIGGERCAVAAAAIVFKFYGIDVDPQQLNWFLSGVGGYTERSWLYRDRAALVRTRSRSSRKHQTVETVLSAANFGGTGTWEAQLSPRARPVSPWLIPAGQES